MTNSIEEKVNFNPDHVVGVVDLRSLGYYKIKQQNLSHYHLESAENVCTQYNELIDTLRKKTEKQVCMVKTNTHGWMIVMRESI